VVISLNEGIGTASARSMEGFPLCNALQYCSDILENFGGHKMAAGLTIREENIAHFREHINRFAKETFQVKDLLPSLRIDQQINLNDLSMELIKQIDLLDPYGEGNPQPVFCTRGLSLRGTPQILGRETLKFWVTDGRLSISAVGFGMSQYLDIVKSGYPIDLAYELSIDDWNKAPTLQLKIKDIKLGTPTE
jgi:single-stranded-DNA-specific exonuclease